MPVPFNRPSIVGREFEYMQAAVDNARLAGDGPFTHKCHALLEGVLGVHKALLTTSCTAALEMSALLLDLRPGDEVIVPSFTFVSSVNAFVIHGASPVFVDVRPDTLNIDESLIEQAVTPHTRAIVVVHYAGVGCAMESIMAVAARHGVAVIEDNAHGLFARYQGRHLGTFGCMAALSFHDTKNFTCGEGGALLINDPALVDRAEIIREKGTNRSHFFRGQVDKYTWVDVGASYLPSDMLAAFLLAQLEQREFIQSRRRAIWDRYARDLAEWAEAHDVALPTVPEGCEQSYHLFYLLMPSLERRQAFMAHLKARGISAVFHYQPLHLSPMGLRYGGRPGACPVTEDIADRLVRLPFYHGLSEQDQTEVIEAVRAYDGGE